MRTSKTNLQERLFAEKNLRDVLLTFESAFPIPLTCKWLSGWAIIMCGILAVAYWQTSPNHSVLQKMAAEMVGFGFVSGTALLGVVIAGFSIFASSLDPDVVSELAETDYKENGPNNLSFVFSSFIYVLVALFGLLVTSLAYFVSLSETSIVYQKVVEGLFPPEIGSAALLAFLCLYFGQLIFVISVLYSFIWNLHQVLMVIAATKILNNN